MTLCLSGDTRADELISKDPFALLIGMVLDQQIPLERAFAAPLVLAERLRAPLTADVLAAMAPEQLVEAFCAKPALHRFPAAMAGRVQQLAHLVVDEYGGEAGRIWGTATSGDELLARVVKLPGFGRQKAKIFVALLGKQLGVEPPGWRSACAPFGGESSLLSIADIDSAETLAAVREHKRALKAKAKAIENATDPAAGPTAGPAPR